MKGVKYMQNDVGMINKIKDIFFRYTKGSENSEETLEDWSLKWLNNAKLHIKESSYVKYYNILKNHIIPSIGKLNICDLTTDTAEVFISEKLKNGKINGDGGLSEKTVKDILAVLKEICRFAEINNIKVPCHLEVIKIKSYGNKVNVLSKNEQYCLENLLMSDNDLIKTGILLSLHMGLRIGEVCALKRKHIIMESRELQIRCTMQRLQNVEGNQKEKTKILITEPKSRASVREIPIPEFLLERLKILKNAPKQAYVLTGETERYIEPRVMENLFKAYLKQCKIRTVSYHTLRHTFATRCIETGFDIKSLSEILGHTSVNITLNRYVHSSMEQKRKHMDKIRIQSQDKEENQIIKTGKMSIN